jgi:hypothetical protein
VILEADKFSVERGAPFRDFELAVSDEIHSLTPLVYLEHLMDVCIPILVANAVEPCYYGNLLLD